jgi:DNA invertase Pin-like site-specific DNA recombinase
MKGEAAMKHQFDDEFDPTDDDVQIALDRRRKLSDGDVRMILKMRDAGRSQASIARVFGVHRRTIYRLCNGISRQVVTRPGAWTAKSNNRLTEERVKEILRLKAAGTPVKDIARKFKVTDLTIQNICSKKTWSHVTMSPQSQIPGEGVNPPGMSRKLSEIS